MCGIIGLKLFSVRPKDLEVEQVRAGLQTQSHRGPDATKQLTLGNAVLGHNRLAIIDLNKRSNQPFLDTSGRYALIFNGEIYNYPDLKNLLLAEGVVFQTSSDTEVLLHYLIWKGEEGIVDLNGCFAFAFYDSLEDELLLARDHMGIKPVLFEITANGVYFASELRPFFCFNDQREINHAALSYFCRFTYIPAPKTILKNVNKLLPGHYLKVKGKYLDMVRYWHPASEETFKGNKVEAESIAKELLDAAVWKRLAADVPLGTFLSGGIDSSIVSGIAAEARDELNTFSIGFKDITFFDETVYSKLVAKHIQSVHHPVSLSADEVLKDWQNMLDSFDEPFADSSAIAMYFLSKAAKKQLTVCLSGDGADELLAGYNKHKAFVKSMDSNLAIKLVAQLIPNSKKIGRQGKIKNKLRQAQKLKELLQKKWPEKYWFLAQFSEKAKVDKLLREPIFDDQELPKLQTESLSSFLLADQCFVLPNDMLKKVDLMSMRHSLEVRTPFLDKDFVKFVNSLPDEYKYDNGKGKVLLRDIYGDILPKEIFNRPKQGFEVPLEKWIKASWQKSNVDDWWNPDFIEKQALFSWEELANLKSTFWSKTPGESPVLVWCLIVFQNWYQRWMVKK